MGKVRIDNRPYHYRPNKKNTAVRFTAVFLFCKDASNLSLDLKMVYCVPNAILRPSLEKSRGSERRWILSALSFRPNRSRQLQQVCISTRIGNVDVRNTVGPSLFIFKTHVLQRTAANENVHANFVQTCGHGNLSKGRTVIERIVLDLEQRIRQRDGNKCSTIVEHIAFNHLYAARKRYARKSSAIAEGVFFDSGETSAKVDRHK